MPLDEIDQAALRTAAEALERPGFMAELASWVGKPIEYTLAKLPSPISSRIHHLTTKALQNAVNVAVSSLSNKHHATPARWLHRGAAVLSGGIGGTFGLPALAVELPLSTAIMLRSIADIAQTEGEDLAAISSRLACIEVFALGGSPAKDEAAESSYFASRLALARAVSEATTYLGEEGVTAHAAPALVRFSVRVAQRFAPAVAEKVAAFSVPAIGALGGATVNLVFINYFQRVAQGHFVIRRLERKYGADLVRQEYGLHLHPLQ